MGYCYDYKGLLCCDVCGHAGARKYKCPFGWCQATALCPECKEKHPEYLSKELHRKNGCEKNSQEFERQHKENADLLAQGKYVRVSALWHPPEDKVKVIFEGQVGGKAYFMTQATYHAIPLGVNATIEDYQAKGTITECRNLNIYDPENKPVDEVMVNDEGIETGEESEPVLCEVNREQACKLQMDEACLQCESYLGEKPVKEPAAPVVTTKQVAFDGTVVCGKRGRKTPVGQSRLALEVDEL